MTAGVEREVLGEAVDVGEVALFARLGQLGEGVVGAGHVGGVVLAVVQPMIFAEMCGSSAA